MNRNHSSAPGPRADWGSRRIAARLTLLVAAATLLAATAAGAPNTAGKRSVSTMTVNLYIGASTERITQLDPTDPNYFPRLIGAVTQTYLGIVASQPAVRLGRVADEIAARQPDIVAVEEAATVCVQSPGDLIVGGHTPATTPVFDFEQILLQALAARGAPYVVAVRTTEWDVEMPMMNPQTGGFDDIRQTDHELILVRRDLPPGQFRWSNPQTGRFAHVMEIPALGLSINRGWCAVDLTVRGAGLRYICTHLDEETSPELQVGQARELLDGPANTTMPVILVGDFNADVLQRDGSIAYAIFPAAGFRDSWAELNPTTPTAGLTWGHDEQLGDPGVRFDRRIDYVFVRGTCLAPDAADVIDLSLNRTTPPLWATDHAGLYATVAVEPPLASHPRPLARDTTLRPLAAAGEP